MTNRERFQKLVAGDSSIDRAPVLEWASWWDKTIRFWEREGLPKGFTDRELFDYFGLDHHTQFWFDHYTSQCPKPDGSAHLIESEEDYDRIRPYILPEDAVARRLSEIAVVKPAWERGDSLVWYTVNGYFWFTRELFGDEGNMYSYYDFPELRHRISEDLLQWQLRTIEEFSKYIKADFMTIAEDMSYNKGPMISKKLFDEFMLPYYRRLIPAIKKHGTKVFIDSDGDVSEAIPWFMEAGADGVLPLERQAGVDLVKYRRRYPEFLFIGGFDKMTMFQGEEAMHAEFERLWPVIRSGRYLPGVDHQTPPGVTLENYQIYLRLLQEYAREACRDC